MTMFFIWSLKVPKHDKVLFPPYNCSLNPSYFNASATQLYKSQKKLLYPVNVGRNIARDAAMTHFLLASDIELYPNPGLVRKFLEMIARNDAPLQRKYPRWDLIKYSLMTCQATFIYAMIICL